MLAEQSVILGEEQRAGLPAIPEAEDVAILWQPISRLVDSTLAAAGRSPNTRRSYETAIGLFLQFLDDREGDKIPDDWRPVAEATKEGRKTVWITRAPIKVIRDHVKPSTISDFRAWREAQGDSANTASQRVYAINSFLSVAYRDGILTDKQARKMDLKAYKQRQKRDEKPTGRRLSIKEARALRAAPNTLTNKGKRDLAILDCMLFLGLRREEAANLNTKDFVQDGGRWWLVLTGKGQKTRRLKVHDTLFKSLDAWFHASGLEWTGEACIFKSVNKGDNIGANCINASVIGRLVAEYGELAGLAPRHGKNCLSPHDLRRTCARNAYDNGASLLLVQNMLGHSDPKTTARYIGAFEDDDNTAIDYVKY